MQPVADEFQVVDIEVLPYKQVVQYSVNNLVLNKIYVYLLFPFSDN